MEESVEGGGETQSKLNFVFNWKITLLVNGAYRQQQQE